MILYIHQRPCPSPTLAPIPVPAPVSIPPCALPTQPIISELHTRPALIGKSLFLPNPPTHPQPLPLQGGGRPTYSGCPYGTTVLPPPMHPQPLPLQGGWTANVLRLPEWDDGTPPTHASATAPPVRGGRPTYCGCPNGMTVLSPPQTGPPDSKGRTVQLNLPPVAAPPSLAPILLSEVLTAILAEPSPSTEPPYSVSK